MEAKDRVVYTRVSRSELANIDRAAERLGITRSQLMRALTRLDIRTIEGASSAAAAAAPVLYLITESPCNDLTRTIRKHGYLYNQVAHALNKIKNNRSIPARIVHDELEPALASIEEIRRRMTVIEAEWEAARWRLAEESLLLLEGGLL